jgi:hypothetical protein
MGSLVKQLDFRVYRVRIAAIVDARAERELFRMVE